MLPGHWPEEDFVQLGRDTVAETVASGRSDEGVNRGRFEGKAAIVTGAGSGIGRAAARRLAAGGACVLGVDIDDRLRAVKAEVGDLLSSLDVDLGDPETCATVVGTCVAEFGALDVLGNVAGIFRAHHATEVTPAEYHRILAVNLDAYVFLSQAAIPHLLERDGNIVNVASNTALQGIPYAAPYAVSKGGVLQLTRPSRGVLEAAAARQGGSAGGHQHRHRHGGDVPARRRRAAPGTDGGRAGHGGAGGSRRSVRLPRVRRGEERERRGVHDRQRPDGQLSRLAGRQVPER